jgi:hypothetical protein
MAIIGLACFVSAFIAHSNRKTIEEHGKETEAEIIEVRESLDIHNTMVLGYYADGVYYKSNCITMKLHKAGEKIKIMYRPDNPKFIILKEETGKKSITGEIVMASLGFLTLAGIIIWRVLPK